jgi:hypothetical protein
MAVETILLSLIQPSLSSPLGIGNILTGAADLFGGVILFIIGIAVIVLIVAAAVVLLPAIIVAALVWFLTGSFFYAGIAFLAIALLSIIAVADD